MSSNGQVLFVQHQDDCPPGYVGERLEQHGMRVQVVRAQDDLPDPRDFDLIVPLGSDDSAYDDTVPYVRSELELLETALSARVPVFGICFGAQLLARTLGGRVFRSPSGPEIGWLRVDTSQPEFVEPGPWLVWHLDVMGTPPGGVEVARTPVGTQAYVHGQNVGMQFHPEATLESARIWADHYRAALAEVGVDHDGLIEETRACQADARSRAHQLTDRVLAHTGVVYV